jgi:23S rRNA (adenine-N6)-dimethyltransferase
VAVAERRRYERFVRAMFAGAGRGLDRILSGAAGIPLRAAQRALVRCGIDRGRLPRDLAPEEWARLWAAVARR